MNKRKILLGICSTLICFNIFTTSAFAIGGNLDAGNAGGSSSGGGKPSSGNNSGGSSSTNNSSKPGSSSSNSGSSSCTPSNPIRKYRYSYYDSDMNVAFSNFAGAGSDGSRDTYKTRYLPYTEYVTDDGTSVREYIPTINFEKFKKSYDNETSRVTDYYTWTCSGEESWTVREGQ